MKKTTRSHHDTLNQLNITPLLDLVFVLLVIFIITTPQLVNDLEMTLPSGKPPAHPHSPKPKLNTIFVNEKGQAFLNKQPLATAALQDTLAGMKADNPALEVVVKGADAVDYQSMIRVLDVLRQLDITNVGLATAAPAAGTP